MEIHISSRPITVTPLVLQVYFRTHTESLDNANCDTQSKFMRYHSEFLIRSTLRICSPIGKYTHYTTFTLIDQCHRSSRTEIRCVLSLSGYRLYHFYWSMVILYRQETLFPDAEQRTIHSCCTGFVLGEMRCRQYQTIMTSRDMQSQI
jgi:hypothetical protein